jgi:predicted HTH transcriptional regulator
VESIKLGSAVVRNPFIANFCAKTMPYRGLGSGIIRALQEEPNIKFINEPAGMQFISIIDRIADEGVNELESLILTFLEKKPGAKGYEIAEYIQKGAATTERYLRSLKDKELIEYKGSRKTGGYYKK